MTDLTNKSVHHLSVALQCWAAGLELSSSARNLLEEAAATIEELSAIVARLPKTADGVPVVPGTRIHPLHPLTSADEYPLQEDSARVDWCITDPLSGEILRQHDGLEISTCYSTKEAAAERAMQESSDAE